MFYKKNDKVDPLILSGDEEDDGLVVEKPGKSEDKVLSEDEINLRKDKGKTNNS